MAKKKRKKKKPSAPGKPKETAPPDDSLITDASYLRQRLYQNHSDTSSSLSFLTTHVMLLVVFFLLLASFYYLVFMNQDQEPISYEEFVEIVHARKNFSIVQSLYSVPFNSTGARPALQNCGVDLSYELAIRGKNVTNYAFDAGGQCIGGPQSMVKEVEECEREMQGSYIFYIVYDGESNKTVLYEDHAVYHGDTGFLQGCAIAGIID